MRRYLLVLLIMACGGDGGTVSSGLDKKCQDSCMAQTTAGCPGASCAQCPATSATFDRIGCATPWGVFYDCVKSAADVCAPDECVDELTTASDCVANYCTTHSADPACATE